MKTGVTPSLGAGSLAMLTVGGKSASVGGWVTKLSESFSLTIHPAGRVTCTAPLTADISLEGVLVALDGRPPAKRARPAITQTGRSTHLELSERNELERGTARSETNIDIKGLAGCSLLPGLTS